MITKNPLRWITGADPIADFDENKIYAPGARVTATQTPTGGCIPASCGTTVETPCEDPTNRTTSGNFIGDTRSRAISWTCTYDGKMKTTCDGSCEDIRYIRDATQKKCINGKVDLCKKGGNPHQHYLCNSSNSIDTSRITGGWTWKCNNAIKTELCHECDISQGYIDDGNNGCEKNYTGTWECESTTTAGYCKGEYYNTTTKNCTDYQVSKSHKFVNWHNVTDYGGCHKTAPSSCKERQAKKCRRGRMGRICTTQTYCEGTYSVRGNALDCSIFSDTSSCRSKGCDWVPEVSNYALKCSTGNPDDCDPNATKPNCYTGTWSCTAGDSPKCSTGDPKDCNPHEIKYCDLVELKIQCPMQVDRIKIDKHEAKISDKMDGNDYYFTSLSVGEYQNRPSDQYPVLAWGYPIRDSNMQTLNEVTIMVVGYGGYNLSNPNTNMLKIRKHMPSHIIPGEGFGTYTLDLGDCDIDNKCYDRNGDEAISYPDKYMCETNGFIWVGR